MTGVCVIEPWRTQNEKPDSVGKNTNNRNDDVTTKYNSNIDEKTICTTLLVFGHYGC